jgi:uncharacterized protein (TIGR03435 family)
MQGAHQFVAKGYTVRFLVSAAYNLPPRAISGGPDWIDVERYDILASTPGDTRPNLEQQMAMVRTLLAERFSLKFHTEPKEFPVYVLTVAKGGSKLKETATPDAQPIYQHRVPRRPHCVAGTQSNHGAVRLYTSARDPRSAGVG